MTEATPPPDRQPSRLRIGLTLAALFAAYLLLASSSTLWDRDEPRFARCTVEMVESGDLLVPTYNGELRPDKPAGIYWLMALGYKTLYPLGQTELAFRLPSAIGIAGTAFLTFLIGRRLFNTRVGYRAMIFYGSALMVAYMATASTADGAMNGLITLALWCFIEIVHGGKKLPLLILMAIALSAGQLVKGPVALAVPLMSMATMGLLGWRMGAFTVNKAVWLGVGAAALVSFIAFAAWGIPANEASGGKLLELGLGKHVGERAISPQENHGGSGFTYLLWLPFYIPVILIAFVPWSMHLPAGLLALVRGRLGDAKQRAILWGYLAPTFTLMTLVATKLPHYVLPIFPALAILGASVVDDFSSKQGGPMKTGLSEKTLAWLKLGRFFNVPILVGIAMGGGAVGWLVSGGDSMKIPGALLAIVLLAMSAALAFNLRKGRIEQATRVPMVGLPVALLLLCFGFLPALESEVKPSKPIADAIREAGLAEDNPVMLCGFNEPSLVFYLNRPHDQPVGFLSTAEEIQAWAYEEGPGVLVIPSGNYEANVLKVVGELPLKEIFAASAVQYSGGGVQSRLLVLRRN